MIILITGAPHTGKTTLANALLVDLNPVLIHTDDVKHLPWEIQPMALMELVQAAPDHRPVIVEGVSAARLLSRGIVPRFVLWCTSEDTLPKHKGMAGMVKKKVLAFAEQHPDRVVRVPKVEEETAGRVAQLLGAQ